MSNEQQFKEVFAENLKYYMKKYNLNQTQISEIAHVSKQSVSNWLNCKLLPRMGSVELLSSYFNIKKTDLLEKKEDATPKDRNEDIAIKLSRWFKEVGTVDFNDEEVNELITFAKFLLSKRKGE